MHYLLPIYKYIYIYKSLNGFQYPNYLECKKWQKILFGLSKISMDNKTNFLMEKNGESLKISFEYQTFLSVLSYLYNLSKQP